MVSRKSGSLRIHGWSAGRARRPCVIYRPHAPRVAPHARTQPANGLFRRAVTLDDEEGKPDPEGLQLLSMAPPPPMRLSRDNIDDALAAKPRACLFWAFSQRAAKRIASVQPSSANWAHCRIAQRKDLEKIWR